MASGSQNTIADLTAPTGAENTPMMSQHEAWLRGPVPDVSPWLQPVAHALQQVLDDVAAAVGDLHGEALRAEPGGAASVAFHCHHLAGSTDRLLSYARGEMLSHAQVAAMKREREESAVLSRAELLRQVQEAVERALAQVRATPDGTLTEARAVGRARLPSTVLGLLFHAAEHATRHAGQIITTAKIVRGLRPDGGVDAGS
jgi:uncharacterized damage-inducible protein DinB